MPVSEAARRICDGQGSFGNGAAMRIAPLAVRYADAPDRLRDEAERSARLTHAHAIGIDGAVVQAGTNSSRGWRPSSRRRATSRTT